MYPWVAYTQLLHLGYDAGHLQSWGLTVVHFVAQPEPFIH